MKKQPIYIALGGDPERKAFTALCWHSDKQRVGEVGKALAEQMGVTFGVVLQCLSADYEAASSFPDDHPLNKSDHLFP